MQTQFRILTTAELPIIIPLLQDLGEYKVAPELLKSRLEEMAQQHYKCIGVFNNNDLIGMSGMWFQTRHYAGKSVEIDHVYLAPEHRNKGLGSKFMEFIETYVKSEGCQAIELNSYVENFPSHKFYYNRGFIARGFHYIKWFN